MSMKKLINLGKRIRRREKGRKKERVPRLNNNNKNNNNNNNNNLNLNLNRLGHY